MVVQRGSPDDVALKLAKKAALVVTDRGYLNIQKKWRERVADEATCKVVQIEGDVVVPVELASDKREYAARTLRPKIHKHLETFLVDLSTTAVDRSSLDLELESVDLSDPVKLAKSLKLEQQVEPVTEFFTGGTTKGKAILRNFLDEKFSDYAEHRNQPQTNDVSHMSKYLHFGQISPVWIAPGSAARERCTKKHRDVYRRTHRPARVADELCEFYRRLRQLQLFARLGAKNPR